MLALIWLWETIPTLSRRSKKSKGYRVFYGLGNFVFDQGLRDHQQGVILLVHFEGTRFAGYDLIPTHVDPDGRVHIADPDEAQEILQRIEQASETIAPGQ